MCYIDLFPWVYTALPSARHSARRVPILGYVPRGHLDRSLRLTILVCQMMWELRYGELSRVAIMHPSRLVKTYVTH